MKKISFLVAATDSFALRTFRALLLALGLVAMTQGTASAQSTWTVTGTAADSWNANGNWSPNTAFPNGAGVTANVTANITVNEAISLNQAITLGTLNIGDSTTTSNTYTIAAGTGGSLIMNDSGLGALIAQSSTSDGDTISAPISMADSNGTTALTISNASASHTLTISGGITSTGSGSNLVLAANAAGAITLSTAAINNQGTITNSGSSTGLVTISGGVGSNVTGITENSAGSALTISTTALTVNSGGTTLTNSNASGTALLTVSGGINGTGNLILDDNSGTAGITISTTGVNSTGSITNSGSGAGTTTISAVIGSTVNGVEENSANSELILSGANTFTGGLTILNGTVVAGVSNVGTTSGAAGPSTHAISLGGGGNASLLANTFTVSNAINVGSTTGTLSIGNNGTTTAATFSGAVALGGNNLTISSTGTTGSTTVTGGVTGTGTLTIADGSTSGAITISTTAVNNTGTIINNGAGGGTATISGGVGSSVTGITENSAGSALTIGALTVNSGGTTLTNSNASGTALLTVSGGIAGTGNLILDDNSATAGITISTTGITNVGAITDSGTGAATTTISSAIGGTVTGITVTTSATGKLILSGANTGFGGNLNLNSTAGTPAVVQLTNASALTATNVVVFGAGSTTDLQIGNSLTIGGLSTNATVGTPTVDVTSTATTGVLTLFVGSPASTSSTSYTFAGVLQDYSTVIGNVPLALVKSGTGTQILSGANTYSGGTTVNVGTLEATQTSGTPFGAADSLVSNPGVDSVTLNGGVLNLTPALVSSGTAISLSSGSTSGAQFNVSGGGTLALNKNGNESLTYTVGPGSGTVLNVTANGSLVILPASGLANLGSATAGEQFIISGTAPATLNGMVLPSIVGQDTDGTGDFLNYTANGFVQENTEVNHSGTVTLSTTTEISNINGTTTLSGTNTPYALRVGAFTVTLTSPSTLTPGSGGIILNGGTISGTGTVALGSTEGEFFAGTANGTISSAISGTGGLTIFGPGTLTLGGTNTSLTGGININGTLSVNSTANLNVNTLNFNGGTLVVGTGLTTLAASETLAINPGGGTLNVSSAGLVLPSTDIVNGTGILTKTGTGDLRTNTNFGNTGGLAVLNGTVDVGGGSSAPTVSGTIWLGDVTGSNSTALRIDNTTGGGISNSIIVQSGNSGTATLANISTGNSTFGGTITLGNDGGTGHGVTLSDGGFDEVAFEGTIQDPTNLVGAGGVVTISDSDVLVVEGNNTFSGGVTLAGGNLYIHSGTAIGTGTLTINAGGIATGSVGVGSDSGGSETLTNNNAQVWNSDWSFSGGGFNLNMGTGAVNLGSLSSGGTNDGAATRTVAVTNTLTVGGVISNGTNSLTTGLSKSGSGILVLTGTNAYTGPTTINYGTIQTGNASALGTGQVQLAQTPLAILNLNSTPLTVGSLADASVVVNPVLVSGGTGYSASATLALTFTGGGGSGAVGTATTNGSGVVTAVNITSYGSGYTSEPVIGITGSHTTAAVLTSPAFSPSIVSLGSGTLTIAGTNGSAATFSGAIIGTGSLIKNGAGTQVLAGPQSYTGTTTVNLGNLTVTGASAASSTQTLNTTASTTVSTSNTTGLVVGESVSGTGITAGSYITAITPGTSFTLNQAAAAETGTTLTFAAYGALGTGNATVSGGTLQLGNGVNNAGLVSGQTITDNATVALDNNGTAQTLANVISGSGLVNQIGGTFLLSVANTYGGATNVYGGSTLEDGVGNALPTGTVLTLGNASDVGALTNTFALNGFNQSIGALDSATNGNGGYSDIVTNGVVGTNTLTLTGLNSSSSPVSSTFAGVIQNGASGTTALAISGGKHTLSGISTYSGGTTITGGTLYVNNNPSLGSGTGSGSVTVQTGGTLAGSGKVGGAVTVQSGGTLASGAAQTNVVSPTNPGGIDTVTGTGLTADLAVNGGATLQFDLGAGASTNISPGVPNFASPNLNSTYLTSTGPVDFGTTGGAVNINLVDLTAFSTDTLQLRYQNPYLLIAASSGLDSSYDLVTTGGYDQNGYVLGIGSSDSGTSILNTFNLSATDINGSALTNPYNDLQLYLYNGDLEVVPEPGTWALMLGGLALLVFVQQRRKSRLS